MNLKNSLLSALSCPSLTQRLWQAEPSIQIVDLRVEIGRILLWKHVRANIDTRDLFTTAGLAQAFCVVCGKPLVDQLVARKHQSLAVCLAAEKDFSPDLDWKTMALNQNRGDWSDHTSQFSWRSATLMAQSPAPKPQSRTLRGFRMGGNISLSSKARRKTACIAPSRSISSWAV